MDQSQNEANSQEYSSVFLSTSMKKKAKLSVYAFNFNQIRQQMAIVRHKKSTSVVNMQSGIVKKTKDFASLNKNNLANIQDRELVKIKRQDERKSAQVQSNKMQNGEIKWNYSDQKLPALSKLMVQFEDPPKKVQMLLKNKNKSHANLQRSLSLQKNVGLDVKNRLKLSKISEENRYSSMSEKIDSYERQLLQYNKKSQEIIIDPKKEDNKTLQNQQICQSAYQKMRLQQAQSVSRIFYIKNLALNTKIAESIEKKLPHNMNILINKMKSIDRKNKQSLQVFQKKYRQIPHQLQTNKINCQSLKKSKFSKQKLIKNFTKNILDSMKRQQQLLKYKIKRGKSYNLKDEFAGWQNQQQINHHWYQN